MQTLQKLSRGEGDNSNKPSTTNATAPNGGSYVDTGASDSTTSA